MRKLRAKKMSNGVIRVQPKSYKRYEEFMAKMFELRGFLVSRNALMAAQPVKAEAIISESSRLARIRDQLLNFLAIPNMVQDIKDYEGDQNYDIVVIVQPTQTGINDAIALIDASLPEHNGEKLAGHFIDGYWESKTFSSQNTQGLRAAYQVIIDTIGTME